MNTENSILLLTLLAALGSGLMAGLFFAFSNSVMGALGRLRPAEGIAAMQAINVVILNPVFLGSFMGTAVISVILLIYSLLNWQAPGSIYMLLGSLLYLGGNFLVTGLFNVPRNDRLAAVDPSATAAVDVWQMYLSSWTRWNHVRVITAVAAAALFTMAIWV